MVAGACVVAGGMHGCRGVYMVAGGSMHGCWGGRDWHAWLQGTCVVAGGCVGYDEIRSMSGRYASYWNAFLYSKCLYQNSELNGIFSIYTGTVT